jgi:hypothetical protein
MGADFVTWGVACVLGWLYSIMTTGCFGIVWVRDKNMLSYNKVNLVQENDAITPSQLKDLAQSYQGRGVIIYDWCCALTMTAGAICGLYGRIERGELLCVLGLYGGVVGTIVTTFQLGLEFKSAKGQGYAPAQGLPIKTPRYTITYMRDKAPNTSWLSHCTPRTFELGNTVAWPAWATIVSVTTVLGSTGLRLVWSDATLDTDEEDAARFLNIGAVVLVVACLVSAVVYRVVMLARIACIACTGDVYRMLLTDQYRHPQGEFTASPLGGGRGSVQMPSEGNRATYSMDRLRHLVGEGQSTEEWAAKVNRYICLCRVGQVLYPCCAISSVVIFTFILYHAIVLECVLLGGSGREDIQCSTTLFKTTVYGLGITTVLRATVYSVSTYLCHSLYRELTKAKLPMPGAAAKPTPLSQNLYRKLSKKIGKTTKRNAGITPTAEVEMRRLLTLPSTTPHPPTVPRSVGITTLDPSNR